MNWNRWIRQTHRWLALVFSAAVIANFVFFGMGKEEYPAWLGLLTLGPLALLWFSGMYLFVLPYAARWRGGRRAAG